MTTTSTAPEVGAPAEFGGVRVKPAKTPNRLQSHFVAFLGGLTVAGFYAGYRFKEDLGGNYANFLTFPILA